MKIKLDERLRAILSEIEGGTLADIGCDHGKLSVSALVEGRVRRVIAVDISSASLQKTVKLAEECGFADAIVCLVGDGFQPISEPVDVAVIAGMGGYETVEILGASGFSGRLVLCPHQDADVLRRYLSGKYDVKKDFIVESGGKFYPIIVAERGSSVYAEEELAYGLNRPQTEAYRKMLFSLREKLGAVKASADIPENAPLVQKLKEVEKLCRQLEN